MSVFTDAVRGRLIKPQNGIISGLGASDTLVVKGNTGLTYGFIILRCTIAGVAATRAELETMLKTMRITISGNEKGTLSVKQHIAKTEFYCTGVIGDTGNLVIPFTRGWMRDTRAVLEPNYGTLGETSFVIEIEQDATSTIDKVAVHVGVNPLSENLGAHLISRRMKVPLPGAGIAEISDLSRKPGEFLYALHIEAPTIADVARVAFFGDDNRHTDVTQAILASVYKMSNPVRTPQTAKGFMHIDFCAEGFDTGALPIGLANGTVLEIEMSTAVAGREISIIAEYGRDDRAQAA